LETHKGEIKGKGFILRITPAQEADVIVRFLTYQGTALSAFARAALKSRKRFGGALQPLLHVNYRMTVRTQNGLPLLEEISVTKDFPTLTTNFDRLTHAAYIVELIEKTTHEGLENTELYNLLGSALRGLDMGLPIEGVVTQFEVKLLSLMGWLPSLGACNLCGSNQGELTLDPGHGTVVCSDCGYYPVKITPEMREIIMTYLRTSILKNNSQGKHVQQISYIMQACLKAHGGLQELKSLKFKKSAHLS
jgi:DNA repair protein RecO (recombination protein O)